MHDAYCVRIPTTNQPHPSHEIKLKRSPEIISGSLGVGLARRIRHCGWKAVSIATGWHGSEDAAVVSRLRDCPAGPAFAGAI
jgi:hypothetical protein